MGRWHGRSRGGLLLVIEAREAVAWASVAALWHGFFPMASVRVHVIPRRPAAFGAALGSLIGTGAPLPDQRVLAAQKGPLRLRQVIAEPGLEWRLDEYEAMRDDELRTSGYAAAIQDRIAKSGSETTAVDIGTGPFALLALIAARAGARRVYAIEKTPAVAALAREAVAAAGMEETVKIIEGESTQVQLPERVDFVVSELIGSIAKQEGVQRIIEDASQRFLKARPSGAKESCPQMIPLRCQTYIAPVSYAYHKLMRVKPENLQPVRLDSESRELTFLSEPQLLEQFDYCNPGQPGKESNRIVFRLPKDTTNIARDFSGFAMWCKVYLDDKRVIEVRGTRSHWAYVVALMSTQPIAIEPSSEIELQSSIDFSVYPIQYNFDAKVVPV